MSLCQLQALNIIDHFLPCWPGFKDLEWIIAYCRFLIGGKGQAGPFALAIKVDAIYGLSVDLVVD